MQYSTCHNFFYQNQHLSLLRHTFLFKEKTFLLFHAGLPVLRMVSILQFCMNTVGKIGNRYITLFVPTYESEN